MPGFDMLKGSNRYESAVDTTTTNGVAVATGNNDVKGSWVELIASTAFDADGFYLSFIADPGIGDFLVDIGTGAAASETVILENLLFGGVKSDQVNLQMWIPLPIPEGTRIAARGQYVTTGGDLKIALHLYKGTFQFPGSLARATTWGADTSDSGGTSVDPGGSANTKGSWTQIVSSTDHDIKLLYVLMGSGNNTIRNASTRLIDVGVGAAASEQVIVPDLFWGNNVQGDNVVVQFGPFFVDIPEGERIAIRQQCTDTDATDRLTDFTLLGLG